ncbi:unnamed protein product [Pylaiella littoralis]
MRLQSERANAVMGYWQDGLKETMPKRLFKGKGWGVDPKAKGREEKELTGKTALFGHLTIRNNLHRHVQKDETITCGCNPNLPPDCMCKSCGCNGSKCSLACGCRGRCNTPGAPVAGPGAPVPDTCRLFLQQSRMPSPFPTPPAPEPRPQLVGLWEVVQSQARKSTRWSTKPSQWLSQ